MYFFSPSAALARRLRAAPAILALLVVAGCATAPPPNDAMNLAQYQLQAARDAGAADYAPVDLGFAQDKFQQAQAAMEGRKYADAANLAEESGADAELARVKARLGAARAEMQDKLQQNTRLRSEGEELAARQQQMEQAAPTPAPAPDSSAPLPVGDMPAPSASVLGAPAPSTDNPATATSGGIPGGQP